MPLHLVPEVVPNPNDQLVKAYLQLAHNNLDNNTALEQLNEAYRINELMLADAHLSADLRLSCAARKVTILVNKGKLLEDLNRGADAMLAYDEAIALPPQADTKHALLMKANLVARPDSADAKLRALPFYERAINLDPRFAEPYVRKVILMHGMELYSEVIACVARAEANEIRDFALFIRKAEAFEFSRDPVNAILYYQRCIEINHLLSHLPYLKIMMLCMDRSDLDTALRYCGLAADIRFANPAHQRLISGAQGVVSLRIAGRFTLSGDRESASRYNLEALAFFNSALAIDPRNEVNLSNKIVVLKRLNRSPEVIDSYKQLLSINPRAATVYIELSNFLYLSDEFDESIEAIDEGIVQCPAELSLRFQRARLFNTKRLKTPDEDAKAECAREMLEAVNHVLYLEPANLTAFDFKLLALFELKRYEEAIAVSSRYIELLVADGSIAAVNYKNKGFLLALLSNNLLGQPRCVELRVEAMACYRQALALDPNHKATLVCMLEILRADTVEAQECRTRLDAIVAREAAAAEPDPAGERVALAAGGAAAAGAGAGGASVAASALSARAASGRAVAAGGVAAAAATSSSASADAAADMDVDGGDEPGVPHP